MTSLRSAVALTGAPGSGKSATARELAARTGAALLDLDTLTNPLVDRLMEALSGDGLDDRRVADQIRTARYECLVGAAEDCLAAEVPVVLVAPFTRERQDAEAWAALADRLGEAGGEARLVWLRITADELGRRLVARGAGRDHAKLRDLDAHLATVDLSPPTTPHLAVDASASPPLQAEEIRRALA